MALRTIPERRPEWRILSLFASLTLVLTACGGTGTPTASPTRGAATATPAASATAVPATATAAATTAAAPTSPAAGGEDLVAKFSTDYLNDKSLAVPEGDPVDTSKFKKDGPYTIGFINWSAANSWVVQVNHEVEHERSLYGPAIKDFIVVSADGDANRQISQIEDMVTRKVDALLIIPTSGEAIAPAVEKATDAGVPVIVFGASTATKKYVTYLQADEKQFGRVIADFLMKELACKGSIIVLNGLSGNSTSDLRREGLSDSMKACPDGGAGIKILAEEDASWAYDQGKIAVERMLAAHPQIDGVWSQGGAMTQGAIDAFEAAGRPLVPMTGEDNNGFMLAWQERISKGFKAISASEPTWQSRVALQAALRVLQGQPVAPFYALQVPTITEADVAKYVRPTYNDSYWTNSLLPKEVADKIYTEQ